MASKDPVALDLFCARYLYKGVPKGTIHGHPFAMWNPLGDVRFDPATLSIVSSSQGNYETPVENTYLFSYSEARGLGLQIYHVRGIDRTAGELDCLLLSQEGHFGRAVFNSDCFRNNDGDFNDNWKIHAENDDDWDDDGDDDYGYDDDMDDHENEDEKKRRYQWSRALRRGHFVFQEIITKPQYAAYGLPPFYFSEKAGYWPLQRCWFKLAKANDLRTQAVFGFNPGYKNEMKALDVNRDSKLSFADEASEIDNIFGWISMYLSLLSAVQFDQATAHVNLKRLKYATAGWNVYGTSTHRATAMWVAWGMSQQPQTPETVDPFFGVPWGRDDDGVVHWPSLQFAQYVDELTALTNAYGAAASFAEPNGLTFSLFAPDVLPYFPNLPTPPFESIGEHVVSTNDPELICTIKFFDSDGNEVATW